LNIKIDKISKSFGDKKVLVNFSAVLYENQFNCIMGPSGCGKTTLLNILMGFLSPDSGTVTGVPEIKSAVFQEDRLCEQFSAVSNIRMVISKKVDTDDIIKHLNNVGIGNNSIYLPVCELSGGMRRRVAIVRAVMAESGIIFLDEPFKGLDEETKTTVIKYVKEHAKGKTLVLVTHNIDEARNFSGNIIQMAIYQ
jgi:NitT/TauT family transport system ATP-binding protein